MKKIYFLLFLLVSLACTFLFLAGCSKEAKPGTTTYTYTIYYDVVYKNKTDVLASINGAANTAVSHAGKLYIKDNFIYLNDVNKGIHIIDNSNPSNPVQIAFLAIPGNLDIAIKGNILYADMFGDLLALNITDKHNVKISDTLGNFFPYRSYYTNGYPSGQDDKIMVDWKEKDTTITYETVVNTQCNGCLFSAASSSKSAPGVAGSMAGMVVMGNYLYAINESHSLGIVDVSNPAAPQHDSSFFAGFDLQTIYPFEDKLFLGSAIGMFMYDVSDPQHPVSVGEFNHGRACDPVITDGNYAYVTLHSGSMCGGDQNELDVIDVKNITNSKLIRTYELNAPTGLAKDGNLLFVCDETEVKVYNTANPASLVLMKKIKSNKPYDVIAMNKKLIVVNADGLYQYDYSNINYIKQISFIDANK